MLVTRPISLKAHSKFSGISVSGNCGSEGGHNFAFLLRSRNTSEGFINRIHGRAVPEVQVAPGLTGWDRAILPNAVLSPRFIRSSPEYTLLHDGLLILLPLFRRCYRLLMGCCTLNSALCGEAPRLTRRFEKVALVHRFRTG